MKTCSKCGPTEAEFYPRHGVCVPCVSAHKAAKYKANPGPARDRAAARRQNKPREVANGLKRYYVANAGQVKAAVARRKAAKLPALVAYLDSIKSVPCADCKRRFPVVAMDLDHVRGKKIAAVSTMVYELRPLEMIQTEVAKCEVVCACCHRIRTSARAKARKVA